MNIISTQLLITLFFITTIFFHMAKKNIGVALAYGFQSLIVVILMIKAYAETGSLPLLAVALLLLAIKVITAPTFVIRLIKKHELKFMVSSYLNTPLTLIVVAGLTALAHSNIFAPLVSIIPVNQSFLSLALASLLISFFLIINRKGAISQIVGILSLENSIVAFAFFAGLEQAPALQTGIIFDIAIWVVIATVFLSMIYKHFGSIDVSAMKHLKD